MATAPVQPNRSQKQRVHQASEKAPAPAPPAHATTSVKASSSSHAQGKVRVAPGVQHSASNQAMQRMVRGRVLQKKLAINRPGDIYEQEADRVADAVMRMPASIPTQESVRESSLPSRLQRCSCGKPITSGEQCDTCKKQGTKLQRSSTTASENTSAPPIVHDVLNSAGRPLDAATRQFMEPRFGHNFSNVRIHTGSQAAESARAVNALAYTVGHNVVFGSGQYAPGTQSGRRLLAHELAHTVQQENHALGQLSRKCGPQGYGPTPKDCNLTKVSAADQPKGQRFLFNVNCDDFAPGEQAKLAALLDPKTLKSNDTIEIVGMASFDGDASFNEALSCGRAAATVKLITQKGFGSNIKSVSAAGGVAGTTHDATFRAVDVLIKKGKQDPVCNIAGTPKSSATPDFQEVVTTLQATQFMGDFVLDAQVACQAAQPSDYDDWQVGVVQTALSPIHERCFKFPAGVTPPPGHLHPTDTFVANLAKMPSPFISDRDDTDPIFMTSTDKTDLSTVHGSNTAITVPVHAEDHPRMGAINHLNSLTNDSNDSQVDLFHQHKFAVMLTHVILRNKADSRVIPLFLVGWEFFTNYNYDPSPGTGIPPTSHRLNHIFAKLLEGPTTASSPQPVIGGPSLRSFDRPKFDGAWGQNCPIPQIQGTLQKKLAINQPGDAFEQEADRVADKVMRMADPGSATTAQPVGAATVLQRCACGKSAGTGTQCEECKTQAMQLQRGSASSSGNSSAPSIVHDVLNSPGSSLDAATRRFMEPRFGYDFGGVRVHTDSKAAESARAVGALAYTVGNHIAFNTGQYSGHHEGRRLLAHELAHVVQSQSFPGSTVQRKCSPPQKRVDNSPNEGQKPGYHELSSPCLWLLFGFPIASSEFLLQFAPVVNQLAHFLSQHESAKLRLIGLTDCFGSDDSNRAIAAARAQSVKNAFPDRLHSRIDVLPSNGKTFLFSNETAQHRSFNRSVQIEILPPKDVPCPRPHSFEEEENPQIMRGKCGGGEEALKTAVKLAAVFATTALSRVRNWKNDKGTRDLLDLFYQTKNDLQRQAAADKVVSQLGGIIPRLRAPTIECLVPGSPHYDQVCSDNTIADARGATAIVAPTFCFPQFLNITNSQQSQAVTVIHEFSHNVAGLSDFGKTYYGAATCSPTASTDALGPAQRLTHADTLACFTVAVGVRSVE